MARYDPNESHELNWMGQCIIQVIVNGKYIAIIAGRRINIKANNYLNKKDATVKF